MANSRNQRTLKHEVGFSGKGLHTGKSVQVLCRPAPAGSGIVFKRKDLGESLRLGAEDLDPRARNVRRSVVGFGEKGVHTVEHFLAALWCLGIDNISVEIDGVEMPAMDGSAIEFVKKLKEGGISEQARAVKIIKITESVRISEGDSSVAAMPGDGLSVSYYIEYGCDAIPKENFSIKLDSGAFEEEIAPARTFCLKAEAEALLRAGYGSGADLSNTVVMSDNGPVGTVLRFPNEPVRHKVLDLVGDLYLLGVPVEGKIEARKSGHALNRRLVSLIYERYLKPAAK